MHTTNKICKCGQTKRSMGKDYLCPKCDRAEISQREADDWERRQWEHQDANYDWETGSWVPFYRNPAEE